MIAFLTVVQIIQTFGFLSSVIIGQPKSKHSVQIIHSMFQTDSIHVIMPFISLTAITTIKKKHIYNYYYINFRGFFLKKGKGPGAFEMGKIRGFFEKKKGKNCKLE